MRVGTHVVERGLDNPFKGTEAALLFEHKAADYPLLTEFGDKEAVGRALTNNLTRAELDLELDPEQPTMSGQARLTGTMATTESEPTPRRGRPALRRATPLERDEIVGRALTIVRAEGIDALSYTDSGVGVMVNLATAGVDYHVPFGGRKGSSYGAREQGRHAVDFYTAIKTAYTQA